MYKNLCLALDATNNDLIISVNNSKVQFMNSYLYMVYAVTLKYHENEYIVYIPLIIQ